jgi:hypothetical protein
MARSEMRWEMGFSASEIASTAFSNPKISFFSPDTAPALALGAGFGGVWREMPPIQQSPQKTTGYSAVSKATYTTKPTKNNWVLGSK